MRPSLKGWGDYGRGTQLLLVIAGAAIILGIKCGPYAVQIMSAQILFVDDEAPIRELLSVFFRKKGYTVSTAVNIREAKELVEKSRFDLAILDVNLAGENGLELLSLFKKEYPHMPVILFTGLNPEEELLQRAKEAGADAFMRKSESLTDLFTQVTKHMRAAP